MVATLTVVSLRAYSPLPRITRLLIARDNHPASAQAAEQPLCAQSGPDAQRGGHRRGV